MSKQYSDIEFIEGLKQNNEAVLRALYKKYYTLVLRHVAANSGTSEAAQDIYQETIIVLYENARKPGFELNCQLQTFIYSIARRLWLKQLRSKGQMVKLSDDDEADLPDVGNEVQEHLQKEADIEKMYKSMDQLGEPCRSLLKDFYITRLNMDDISEKYGYTNADNAKNQKYKCLQRLKRYFFNDASEA